MEANLFRYIWQVTKAQQIWVLAIVLLSMPTYFLAFDLPKQIVNGPIQGQGFEEEASPYRFLSFELPAMSWLGLDKPVTVFSGFELDRFQALIALSLVFLALVCINGLFKFYINTYKGRLGERMLRRLRFELMDRTLRFPMPAFRRVKPAEVATMVKDEVEPLGGFIGDAFVSPMFLGGQAATAMIFILVQNAWLGLISVCIIFIQVILIPRLRRRLIELGRQRQLKTRALAGQIGELVEGMAAVHLNDTSNFERARLSGRLGEIFAIRYEIFQRKFFVKFLNNFLAQMTPFLFYSIGGYFALTGRLDIGQLVAVIAAYKDLPSPIKQLIDWDQQRIDVQVKYSQVVEQFQIDGIIKSELQVSPADAVEPITGSINFNNVAATDDSGAKLLERLTVQLDVKQHIAVVGGPNSGADDLCEALARLLPLSSGKIVLNESELNELPEAVSGRRIGYAGSDTPLQQGQVIDNILYSLKHVPVHPATYEGALRTKHERELVESRLTNNSVLDPNADWVDYHAAGATGPQDILPAIKRVLEIVELDEDIMQLGLRGLIDPAQRPDLPERILEARRNMRERLGDETYRGLVEVFDPETYSRQATIGENLLFGTPVGQDFTEANAACNPYLLSILKSEGLEEQLFEMGREIAGTTIELFADLPPDHPFFEQLSFMTADDIPEYQAILARAQDQVMNAVTPDDRERLLALPFGYIEPRHRLNLLDDDLMNRIVRARKTFREQLPDDMRGAVEFYDPEAYNAAASLQDNVLSGRVAYGVAGGPEKVLKLILSVLEACDLIEAVFSVGLDFNVGSSGKRLTQAQRQKTALARALIKKPDILIVNKALATLDRDTQIRITKRVLVIARGDDHFSRFGLVWSLANANLAVEFERVVMMDNGHMIEDDVPDALLQKGGAFAKLVA